MKVILLRHGESVDDILDCYGGAADYELSEDGKKTAEEVALKLSTIPLDAIYSSPLKRAYQTAEAVSQNQQCDIITAPKLYERNSYGVMSGTNKTECKKIYAYLLKDIQGKVGDYYSDSVVMGAEPVSEFDKRIQEGINWVLNDAEIKGFNTIAIVTHGNVTRSIYKNILGVSGKVDLDLLALTYIDYVDQKLTLTNYEGITIK